MPTTLAATQLTTSSLPELAAAINNEHDQFEVALKDGLAHAKTAGDLLRKAKEQVGHGQWLSWLAENCRVTARHAQRYMMLSERWVEVESAGTKELTFRSAVKLLTKQSANAGTKNDTVSHLPIDPPLQHGNRYRLVGQDRLGYKMLLELDEKPGSPGYWVFCHYHDDVADYLGRGIRRDAVLGCVREIVECFKPIKHPRLLAELDGESPPPLEWIAEEVRNNDPLPQAVQWWREEFDKDPQRWCG